MHAFTLTAASPANGEAVVPLALAKAQVRVLPDDTSEDDLIGAFRDAAIDYIEQYTGKALISRSFTRSGAFRSDMVFGIGPVSAVTAITYRDSAGVVVATLTGANVRIDAARGRLWPIEASAWPSDVSAVAGGSVVVTFTAGYAAGACPPALKHAVLMMIEHFFSNRGGVMAGVMPNEVPLGVKSLCSVYRTPTL